MAYKWDILKIDDHFNTESVKCDHLKPALQGCNETSKTLKRLHDLSDLQPWIQYMSNMHTHASVLGVGAVPFTQGVSPVTSTKVIFVTSSLTVLSNPSRVQASRVKTLSWWDVRLKLRFFMGRSVGTVKRNKNVKERKEIQSMHMWLTHRSRCISCTAVYSSLKE